MARKPEKPNTRKPGDPVSMSNLRNKLGSIIKEVERDGVSVVVKKYGKQVGIIEPLKRLAFDIPAKSMTNLRKELTGIFNEARKNVRAQRRGKTVGTITSTPLPKQGELFDKGKKK